MNKEILKKACSLLSLVMMSLTLSSCGSLFPKPSEAPSLCVLNPVKTSEKDLTHVPVVDWHLAIDLPSGGASYDTSRIALMKKPAEINYYSHMEWTDRLPLLLQSLLIKSFENTGKIKGVARASAGINPDRMLMVDIRKFHALTTDASPSIEAELTVKVVNMNSRRIENTKVFSTRTVLPSSEHDQVVASFQEAIKTLLNQIVLWVLTTATPSSPEAETGN